MKTSLIILFLLKSVIIFSQNFILEVGQTEVLKPEQRKMLVDEWIMKDSSTLIIPSSFKNWEIHAMKATFGKDCRIIAIGNDGKNGSNATGIPKQAGYCHTGKKGYNGGEGGYGSNGVNISITVGLISIGNLLINTSGGNGGDGGNGGKGGMGGGAKKGCTCSGGVGGYGGNGGSAGSGGSGGNINFNYWVAASSNSNIKVETGLIVITQRGSNGKAGNKGPGGEGGPGRNCGPIHRGKGSTGSVGENGMTKVIGIKDGIYKLQLLPSPR